MSLASCQKVKQAENGVRSVAVFKLQMSFCTCGVSQHDRVIGDPCLGQGENVLNNIERILN